MGSIVELRQMSSKKLEEMLENAREEMFNLRFQHAATRLEDTSRMRKVRRDIQQLETVLHQRDLAIAAAVKRPEVAVELEGQEWTAAAQFDYEDSVWRVAFLDDREESLVTASVDLNQKRPKGSRARAARLETSS